jgi:L-amino acid N-acyltransferase YncA
VHVIQAGQRQGIGSALLNALFDTSEKEKYWTLEAEIIAENQASLALHRKCGFREVGYREKLGHRLGIWHDVILLERRSQLVGGPNLPTKECEG